MDILGVSNEVDNYLLLLSQQCNVVARQCVQTISTKLVKSSGPSVTMSPYGVMIFCFHFSGVTMWKEAEQAHSPVSHHMARFAHTATTHEHRTFKFVDISNFVLCVIYLPIKTRLDKLSFIWDPIVVLLRINYHHHHHRHHRQYISSWLVNNSPGLQVNYSNIFSFRKMCILCIFQSLWHMYNL